MSVRKALVCTNWKEALPAVAVVALTLILLFGKSFSSAYTLFSNDGPLGQVAAQAVYDESSFDGYWNDTYWVGRHMPSAPFNVTLLIYQVIGSPLFGKQGAVYFLKFYAPLSLLLLGMSAWLFCRQMRFHPVVCVLVGIASALNVNALSNAAWGLPSFAITRAMCFLAMAAIVSPAIKRDWMRLVLAGCAVGVGVSEGFDTGAIFSLYLAAFALVWFGLKGSGGAAKRWGVAGAKVGGVALFAGLMAAHTLMSLVQTQIIDTARNAVPENETEEQRRAREEKAWVFATMASVPKLETLRVFVSGVFGYRMSPDEEHFGYLNSVYWGSVGGSPTIEKMRREMEANRDPSVREQIRAEMKRLAEVQPGAFHFSGSGEYAGLLVVMLAVWAFLQSVRPSGATAFSDFDRWMIRFWTVIAVLSLMAAWGRFFPLYSLIYKLPYFSTIRNPVKFTQPMQLALVVLFAYGLQDLLRRCRSAVEEAKKRRKPDLKAWWKSAPAFDRRWAVGLGVTAAVSVLCLLLYMTSESDVVRYLTTFRFSESQAKEIVNFSFGAVAKYIGWLLVFGGLTIAVLAGFFDGRTRTAGAVFGLFLALDLMGGAKPWIIYENYKERYASNPVIETLKKDSYQHRVSFAQFPVPNRPDLDNRINGLYGYYFSHWLQNQFPYYQIQSSDIHQDPRPAKSKVNFLAMMQTNSVHPIRLWQLTNTRYLFGVPEHVEDLNARADPILKRFKLVARFHMVQNPGQKWPTVQVRDDGPFALFEFGGVLPRARLFSGWEVLADNEEILRRIAPPTFDPLRTVLVEGASAEIHAGSTNQAPGAVTYESYSPKRIVLKAQAGQDSILLLNDQYHPDWKVTVDGEPAELLRCNYLMRGVRVPAGSHEVEFRFRPSRKGFYASLFTLLLSVGLLGYLGFAQPVDTEDTPSPDDRDRGNRKKAGPEKKSDGQEDSNDPEGKPDMAAAKPGKSKGRGRSNKRRR